MSRHLIFGGAFNPVHIGHMRAAIEVAEALAFDRTVLLPSFAPLHKSDDALLRFELRVELLWAAARGVKGFEVSEIERGLPAPSTTIQTLEAFEKTAPGAERHFMLGNREFLRLHKWRNGASVVELAHIVVVCRSDVDLDAMAADISGAWPESKRIAPPAGAVAAFELKPGRQAVVVDLPRIEVSSSLIRERWLASRSLSHLVPEPVHALMLRHRGEIDATWRTAPRIATA